jgi:hypothetical protein
MMAIGLQRAILDLAAPQPRPMPMRFQVAAPPWSITATHPAPPSRARLQPLSHRDGFGARYAQGREALMDRWSEEIVAIADHATLEPNDRRVRTENRRWLMSKLAYRRYSDKLVHSGDAQNPIVVMHKEARISDLSPVSLKRLTCSAGRG